MQHLATLAPLEAAPLVAELQARQHQPDPAPEALELTSPQAPLCPALALSTSRNHPPLEVPEEALGEALSVDLDAEIVLITL